MSDTTPRVSVVWDADQKAQLLRDMARHPSVLGREVVAEDPEPGDATVIDLFTGRQL